MTKDFILWKNASKFLYSSSIASTWVWTPAIFVSSSIAYTDGMAAFLMFLVPNILTLILFAYFAGMIRNRVDGFTLCDVVKSAGSKQERLHLLVSVIVLICSTCVQMLGLHVLFSSWFEIPKALSAILVSIIAFAMVGKSGIKGSIKTDAIKYIVMVVSGLILALTATCETGVLQFTGTSGKSFTELLCTFGITTTIGLLAAPYADQTFWQRVFSIDKGQIVSTFIQSAIFFAVIPLLFGMVGFAMSCEGLAGWNIASAFHSVYLKVILAISVMCALISTLDSNLCAVSSLVCTQTGKGIAYGRGAMVLLLLLGSSIMIFTDVTIVQLFLIYGTTRTCVAIPTILIILNRYDADKLYQATLAAVIIAPLGFILTSNYVFTLIALLFPLYGYKPKSEVVNK